MMGPSYRDLSNTARLRTRLFVWEGVPMTPLRLDKEEAERVGHPVTIGHSRIKQ